METSFHLTFCIVNNSYNAIATSIKIIFNLCAIMFVLSDV